MHISNERNAYETTPDFYGMSSLKKKRARFIHITFLIGTIAKGIDGILEMIGGVFVLFINPVLLSKGIRVIFAHELSEDPRDKLANYLLKAAGDFSLSAQIFSSIYLISHGLIKVILIVALLKRKLWAYPSAIAVFWLFILYQIYRYTLTHSILLIFLSILDAFVIVFTWLEYESVKKIAQGNSS